MLRHQDPKWLAADSAYGSASNLDWLVNEQGIAPHVPVIDKSQREDGTFSRKDFSYVTRYATSIHVQRERRSPRLAISTPITRSGISAPGLSVRACPLKSEVLPGTCPRDGSSAM